MNERGLLHCRACGVRDPRVLRALALVDLKGLLPESVHQPSPENSILDLPQGQRLYPGHQLGRLAQALALSPGDRVLEVGSGCGYVTALLATMGVDGVTVDPEVAVTLGVRCALESLGLRFQCLTGTWALGLHARVAYEGIWVHTLLPNQALGSLRTSTKRLVAPVRDQGLVRWVVWEEGRSTTLFTSLHAPGLGSVPTQSWLDLPQ